MRISDWSSDVCSSDLIADQSRGARRGVAVSGAASATRRAAPRRQLGQDQDRLRSPAAIEPPYAVCGRQKAVRPLTLRGASSLQTFVSCSFSAPTSADALCGLPWHATARKSVAWGKGG